MCVGDTCILWTIYIEDLLLIHLFLCCLLLLRIFDGKQCYSFLFRWYKSLFTYELCKCLYVLHIWMSLAIYVSDQRIMYRSFMHRIIKWSLILSIFFYRGFKITMMIYKCNKELQTYTGIYKKKISLITKMTIFTFQMLF